MDVHEPAVRSYNMRQIKSKNTTPEMTVRRFLHRHGFRYSLHKKNLPGKPDLVFGRLKTVIFVHGCFWHGHEGCRWYVVPKTRTEWWLNKIARNKTNDKRYVAQLRKDGWAVLIIRECDLKPLKREKTLDR